MGFLNHYFPVRITSVFSFPRSLMQKILLISWRIFLWKEKQISLRSGFRNINVLLLWQKQWTMSSLWMQIFEKSANEWCLFPSPHLPLCWEVDLISFHGNQSLLGYFSWVFMLFVRGVNIFLPVAFEEKRGIICKKFIWLCKRMAFLRFP